MKQEEEFTKYEIARILGARALQISMDAPLLLKIDKEKLEEIKYDPLKIAELEFKSKVLPITVKRPLPRKIETKLKREKEEKEIKETGEIMELVQPEDEEEEVEETGEESI